MKVIVLCGGLGTRLEDYSFPKPLNMIYGKPAISFCLKNLPDSVHTIHFIVAPHLIKYNFAEIVTNEFKTKKCIFYYLPYFTRGAIESAFIGTTDLLENHEENIKKPVDADLNLKKREEYAHFATTTSRAKACITFG